VSRSHAIDLASLSPSTSAVHTPRPHHWLTHSHFLTLLVAVQAAPTAAEAAPTAAEAAPVAAPVAVAVGAVGAHRTTCLSRQKLQKLQSREDKGLGVHRQVSHDGPARVMLSGTPTPNGRHQELAGQLDVMGNEAWKDIGGRRLFWEHYCPKVGGYGRYNANGKKLHAALISTFMIRQLRGDVVVLPNKGRSTVSVEVKGRAARDYQEAERNLISWLARTGRDTDGATRAEALVHLTTMRQLAGEAKVDGIASHVAEILDNAPGGVFLVAEHNRVMDRSS
jgi:hypothetical protein